MERQAYLRPSSAAIWSKCHGYAALNAALGTEYVEETDNEIREDGTACHWLAAEGWDAEAATITVRELVADLHRWTIASLHQPHSLGTSGVRVPEAVVAAVGRVSQAA